MKGVSSWFKNFKECVEGLVSLWAWSNNICLFDYQLYNSRLEPSNVIEPNCVPTVLNIPTEQLGGLGDIQYTT